MINTKKAQKEVYQNKVNHGFNLTDINMEFCLLNAEVGEAYMAWLKRKDDTGEELAIYLLGIAEILGIDLGKEIEKKIEKNKKRVYVKNAKGVLIKESEFNGKQK